MTVTKPPAFGFHRRLAIAALIMWFGVPLSATFALEEPGGRLRAGAAKVDITPRPGVSLDGPISKNGPVQGVHDRLHARALVLDDGQTRLAIVVCDACMIGRDVFDAAKERVRSQSGLEPSRMLMAATHTHAAPRAVHIGTAALDEAYHRRLAERIAQAVLQAEENCAPAQVGWGALAKPEFVRCRRWLCEPGSVGANPFGEQDERVKSVAGRSSAIIKPAGPVDPQVSILSVQHADGRPLAVLGNFSVHYCGGYRRGQVSADYFGYYARALEEKLEAGPNRPAFIGMMSNGTSGDTGSLQRDGNRYEPFEWMEKSGRILARQTLRVLDKIKHRRDVTLSMEETEIELGVRRPDQERLAWAKRIRSDPDATHPHRWTPIYAREALYLSESPPTVSLKLQAIRIGELGIAAIPCEVFAETGLAIKRESPHAATFTIELANGAGGYLPTPQQHRWGGYETWPARSSYLEVQAEPAIRASVLKLLQAVQR